jgi:hypothetical protein
MFCSRRLKGAPYWFFCTEGYWNSGRKTYDLLGRNTKNSLRLFLITLETLQAYDDEMTKEIAAVIKWVQAIK